MDRSEIMEIRRLFKTYREEGCPTNGFSGGFIDSEGNVKGYFSVNRFHDLGSAVKKRIFTLSSKTISNTAVTVPVNSYAKDLFEKILATKSTNMELAAELCERVAKAIGEEGKSNTYSVHVLGYTYDPPAKTKDHKTIIDGVSDEIYNFFVCMISPVKTSKESYGYFAEKEEFGMNPLIRTVDNPVCGFVYPDFTGRTSDPDSVLYFRTDKLDISASLFGEEAPPLPEKNTKPVQELSENSPESGTDAPVPSAVERPSVPSLDSGSLSMDEVRGRDIAEERRSTEVSDDTESVEEENNVPLPPSPIKSGKKVRITGNTKGLKRQMVDGVMCLIVPVSDADIE